MTTTDTATGTQTRRALNRTELAVRTVPLRLHSDDPSIHVDDGNLYINEFTETDAAVVRVIGEAEDRAAALHRILALGAYVNEVTASKLDLGDTIERLTSSVEETVDRAVEDIAATATGLLDGENGQLPRTLADFRGQFEAMLGESFNPDSKKSLISKFELVMQTAAEEQTRRLNRALDPHAPDSLVGRLRGDLIKTVKDETAELAKRVAEVREVITSAAAASAATKAMFDKTALKGFRFEDALHELINSQAVHYGDVATQVGKEYGTLGTQQGDEVVTINPEDTRSVTVNVVWEAKTTRYGLRKILDELETAMKNRDACAGIAVFGNIGQAPINVPFAQYGERAVLVIDKDDPDESAVRLAYMWARWVARRRLSENNASIDIDKIETLISDTIRALQHASQVRKGHTMARKGIEEAGEHLDTMTREIKSTMDELRSEIENTE
jgi:hypothetical protein